MPKVLDNIITGAAADSKTRLTAQPFTLKGNDLVRKIATNSQQA